MASSSRSFELATLTPQEFDAVSASHPQGNFQQTSAMGSLRAEQGVEVEYLAVKEHGEIAAATLFETNRSRFSTFCTIHDGPLCDYSDDELVDFFFTQLKSHAKAKGASHIAVTPELVHNARTSDGEKTEDTDVAAPVVTRLESLGYKHGGFTTGYTAVPRWRYLKNLDGLSDESALMKSYDKRTQWSVKRASSMGVRVRELGIDELETFADIEQATAERRNFEFRGVEYFRKFKQAFGDRAHFMVAEILTGQYLQDAQGKCEQLQAKVDGLEKKIAEHETSKLARQLNEERNNLEAANKRLNQAKELSSKGEALPAAASLFVEHPREVIYLFSGSVEEYKMFYASALIQHEAMLHLCVERGVTRYNFYGISGVFDDSEDEGRGVLEFKQGFNGYVEELVGEFTAVVSPVKHAVKGLAHAILRR